METNANCGNGYIAVTQTNKGTVFSNNGSQGKKAREKNSNNKKSFESLFLFRLNEDLQYHASSEHFHRFKSDQGYFAFSFFSLEEANVFANETESLIDMYMPMK